MAPERTPQTRNSYTDAERKAVCMYHAEKVKAGQKCTAEDIKKWFAENHGKTMPQSIISRTLARQSEFLDIILSTPARKHHKSALWPDLDEALYMWHKRVQGANGTVSGILLVEKAKMFYGELYPDYETLEKQPKWSAGWLTAWKKRHNIKQYVRHGESGSAVQTAPNLLVMDQVRLVTSEYAEDDIYNFDETGYYYRMQPDRTLADHAIEGLKKDKARITVGVTVNMSGTDKVPLWVIGTAANPRAFKNVNREAMGCIYRSNKTAWMRTNIMVEYLGWLNRRMKARGRKILLLMDNFSAHECAVEQLGGDTALSHVRICWLPPNMTSKWQPLDQGIIRALKAYTRRHFVRWYIEQIEKCGFDKTAVENLARVDVYLAIVWIVSAWGQVKADSIRHCFQRSTVKVYGPVVGPERLSSVTSIPLLTGTEPLQTEDQQDAAEISDILMELESSIAVLQQHGIYGKDAVDIDKFLEPAEERVEDSPADLEQHILDSFKAGMTEEEELAYEEENGQTVLDRPIVKLSQALHAVRTLQEYERQRDDFSETRVQQLAKMQGELEVKQRVASGNHQTSITSFFSAQS